MVFTSINSYQVELIYKHIDGGLRIQRGKRSAYEIDIGSIKGELLQECRDFLDKAVEKDDEYEKELKKNAIKSMFNKTEQ